MQEEHLPTMINGVKASVGGAATVGGGTWIAQYHVEFGMFCMAVGAICSVVGLVITIKKSREK